MNTCPYLWEDGFMGKTTVELPDPLLREAKVASAQDGIPLKEFFAEAVRERLRQRHGTASGAEFNPPWMQAFGGLRDLKQETRRIQRIIDKEFGQIDEEDWR
jgi:hypothetical protein